jgi:hypothetical protein
VLTDADRRYVREQFVPLEELCAEGGHDIGDVRRRIASRELPAAPYPGLEYVPADYFELPGAEEFRRTFHGPDLDAELSSYLDGTYFVCLRNATVDNIVRKEALVTQVRGLLAEPRPAAAGWRARLRAAVDELDLLERPFSPDFDRQRFGQPPTRDELIDGARRRFPQVWDVAA